MLADIAHPESQLRDHVPDLVDHQAEVVGGLDHIFEAARCLVAERVAGLGIGDPGDLRVHHGLGLGALVRRMKVRDPPVLIPLHGHDRVDQVRDLEILGGQELADRVHDEGPLGDVGLHDRHRSGPPGPVRIRVQNLDVDPVGAAPVQEQERVDAQPGKVLRPPLLEQLDRSLAEEERHEFLQQGIAVVVHRAPDGG